MATKNRNRYQDDGQLQMTDHPLADRLGAFREMAAEAHAGAARATTPEMIAAYEDLAKSWDQLINEIAAIGESDKRG